MKKINFLICIMITNLLFLSEATYAQAYSNPYATISSWAELPVGRTFGAVGDTDVDPDGIHIWAVIRCDATSRDRFGDECVDSDLESRESSRLLL